MMCNAYGYSGREKMKNILLLAYTNFNFGDDMFIYTLCKKFPKYQFVLHASKEYKNTFSQLSNLTITDNNLLEKIYNIILGRFPSLYRYNINTIRYSAVVYVIGGLFDEDETWIQLEDLTHYSYQRSNKRICDAVDELLEAIQ